MKGRNQNHMRDGDVGVRVDLARAGLQTPRLIRSRAGGLFPGRSLSFTPEKFGREIPVAGSPAAGIGTETSPG